MFGLKLSLYRWKRNIHYWLIAKLQEKLNKEKAIDHDVFNDIIHSFAYNEYGYYRLYMKKAPIGELDLETIIQECRNEYTPVNEVDLNYIYNYTIDTVISKLFWFPSVKVCVHNEDGVKYFEIHWKNYKQTLNN